MAAAAARRKPMHPTNLHVNQVAVPNDTVQSKLPDRNGWSAGWTCRSVRQASGKARS